MSAWRFAPGDGGDILSVVDHASNGVPEGVELGIDPALLAQHIAWDIGAEALARALGYPMFLADQSRLVVDLNREVDAPGVVPLRSDGIDIPGNRGAMSGRITLWHDYHDALAAKIVERCPRMLLSVHSFTPQLATRPGEARPWEIGILYNNDDRAARIALPLLTAAGVVVGDQLPYSGKLLNATMNRHGERTGTPYLGIEVRQDLIADTPGVARWAAVLRPVIAACLDQMPARRKAEAR